jgi:excisionase family DNA binding protein
VVGEDRLLTSREVAALLQVHVKTVVRWSNAGYLRTFRTLGGQRRYRTSDVFAFVAASHAEYVAHGRRLPAS